MTESTWIRLHYLATFVAVIIAIALLLGMVLGGTVSLEPYIAVQKTLRQIATALWVFLVPAWFSLEAEIWTPTDPDKLKAFTKGQAISTHLWTVVGGAVAIIIGGTSPAPQ